MHLHRIIHFRIKGYMKFKLIIILVLIFSHSLLCSDSTIPEWAKRYQSGKSIKDASDYYSGIGSSIISKQDADKMARKEFAQNIEVQVSNVQKEILKEKNGKVWESYVSVTEVVTDVNLKGIHIAEHYRDPSSKTYYSMIMIQKDEYNQIVFEELKKELERKIYENKIEEAEQKEGLRSTQEKFKLWLEKETNLLKQKVDEFRLKIRQKQIEKDLIAKKKKEFQDFVDLKPPVKALTFYNAEVSVKNNILSAEIGISPFSIQSFEYIRKIWKFSLGSYSEFHDNKYYRQDISLRFQMLPNSGNFNKITIAIGAIAYDHSLNDKKFEEVDVKVTPCVAGNISLPTFMSSYISVYGEARKYAIAWNSLLFFKSLHDRLSLILEFDYVPDKDYRNKYNDPVIIQPAIRFKTTKDICTTIAYKNNEVFTLSFNVAF